MPYLESQKIGALENLSKDLTLVARHALMGMLDCIQSKHGMTRERTYILASVAIDLRFGQVVDVLNYIVTPVLNLYVFDKFRRPAPQNRAGVTMLIAVVADPEDDRLPTLARAALSVYTTMLEQIGQQATVPETQLKAWHRHYPVSRRLGDSSGSVGLLTAMALTAALGDGSQFRSGRQFAASLGLAPRHGGTGGKTKLRRLRKDRGNLETMGLNPPEFALVTRQLDLTFGKRSSRPTLNEIYEPGRHWWEQGGGWRSSGNAQCEARGRMAQRWRLTSGSGARSTNSKRLWNNLYMALSPVAATTQMT